MSFQFANLTINKIIVHQIFERDENRSIVKPKYNNEHTELDEKGLNELQDRIVKALGSDSHCIEMEISDFKEDSTFQACASLLTHDDEMAIGISKDIVYKLAQAQYSRKFPGGIVVVFKGTVGENNRNYVGIIKAEKHGGFSFIETDAKIFLQYLSNLLLTPQQKLYKIAMFIEVDKEKAIRARRPDEFRVFIFDHNMNSSETKDAAQYFYEGFLGCSISPTNKKLTSDFYQYTKDFINKLDVLDGKKVDLNFALYSYLKVSNSNNVHIAEFADQYLEGDQKDEYLNYMETKDFPTTAVPKDLTYIKNRLRRRRIKFTSDVVIIAPSENFKELVKIVDSVDAKTVIEIKGHVGEQQ